MADEPIVDQPPVEKSMADQPVARDAAETPARPDTSEAAVLTQPTAADQAEADQTDLGRRRFFRQFTSDFIQTVATVAGAATALQRTSAEAASALLDPASAALRVPGAPIPGVDPATGAPIAPAVFRTSFRLGDESLVLVDQRRLPGAVVEYECATAAEVAHAIRERVIRGHPAIAQAAALGLALAADRMRASAPYARRAALHGSGNALINGRPTSFTLRRAVDRMMARYAAFGELTEDGDGLAAAMREEADAIVAEATAAHGRIADLALAALPTPADRPLRVLTLGNSGVLAGGQFGTALGVVAAAAAAGRDVRVVVCETRPLLQGSKLTAWELSNLGIPYTIVADAAAPSRIAKGEVDIVLVAGDHVAANGDVAAVVGTYPLAAVAARHGVPFVVCAPLSTVDLETPDGSGLRLEERAASDLIWLGSTRVTPDNAHAANVVEDVTPADLISAIVTEAGVLQAPFGPALADAIGPTHRMEAETSDAPATDEDATDPVEPVATSAVDRATDPTDPATPVHEVAPW